MFNMKELMKETRGNALFLILIAVALFAALSYAITQSGRGGSGIDREQAAIAAAEMTQYAAGLRTAVMRMTITGANENTLDFDPTDNEGGSPTDTVDTDDVFLAEGGGAIQQDPPNNSGATDYVYLDARGASNAGWYVLGLGSDGVGTGREVLLVASGLDQNICDEINRGLGLTDFVGAANTPVEGTAVVIDPESPPASGAPTTTHTGTFDIAGVEPYACVRNAAAGDLVYYHVLATQ